MEVVPLGALVYHFVVVQEVTSRVGCQSHDVLKWPESCVRTAGKQILIRLKFALIISVLRVYKGVEKN